MVTSGLCKVNGRIVKIGSSSVINNAEIDAINEIILPDTVNFSEFETGIVSSPGDNDPITELSKEYGSAVFYSAVSAINAYFSREDVKVLVTSAQHPILREKINSETPFTPIEVANFIQNLGYTPTSLVIQTSIVGIKIPNEFESFYTQNFTSSTMGSFCAALPLVFSAIPVFFTTLNTIDYSLKNFALNFSLRSLLSQLKDNVFSVIDKVVSKVKSIIENLSLSNVTSQLKRISQDISNSFQRIKESCLAFIDAQNIANYKAGVEKLIDYAMLIFKNPTLQEVQFLLYRFCSFAALVENSILALKNPVETFVNTYRETVSILRSSSSRNTNRAIIAGAVRYDEQVRKDGINNGDELVQGAGNPAPLLPSDYENITPWNEGKGDSRIIFTGRWVSVLGRDGWEQVNPEVRAMLMKAQADFGKQLYLISGYRTKEYNDSLRARGIGAARTSLHIAKMAVDISWAGYNAESREEFITIALANGFKGIGRYGPTAGNFVHIDKGPARTWSKGI